MVGVPGIPLSRVCSWQVGKAEPPSLNKRLSIRMASAFRRGSSIPILPKLGRVLRKTKSHPALPVPGDRNHHEPSSPPAIGNQPRRLQYNRLGLEWFLNCPSRPTPGLQPGSTWLESTLPQKWVSGCLPLRVKLMHNPCLLENQHGGCAWKPRLRPIETLIFWGSACPNFWAMAI